MSSWDPVAVNKYTSIVLKLVSLGLVIAAASFWAGAGVEGRPKYRDEQTLVGGTVWSQILIPMGLLISKLIGEELDVFVQGFFMASGVLLLFATALLLIIGESLALSKQRRLSTDGSALRNIISRSSQRNVRIYLCIGILSLLAGLITLADFILLLVANV